MIPSVGCTYDHFKTTTGEEALDLSVFARSGTEIVSGTKHDLKFSIK